MNQSTVAPTTTDLVPVRRALLSVSDKTGLADLARVLVEKYNVQLISTGGTATALRNAGLPVTDVSQITGFPEIMDGRVKTLHPKVHGGLLGVRSNETHLEQMTQHEIEPIDLVIVNLYPFEKTVAAGAAPHVCIENIDIGGPAMLRSAAKNHAFVAVVVDPNRYVSLLEELERLGGATSYDTRVDLAAEVFKTTTRYDAAVSGWFEENFTPRKLS